MGRFMGIMSGEIDDFVFMVRTGIKTRVKDELVYNLDNRMYILQNYIK